MTIHHEEEAEEEAEQEEEQEEEEEEERGGESSVGPPALSQAQHSEGEERAARRAVSCASTVLTWIALSVLICFTWRTKTCVVLLLASPVRHAAVHGSAFSVLPSSS